MCFSAGASFTASAVISVIGIATLLEAKKPSGRAFAIIPLIFGIQQFAEGLLWLTLQNSDHLLTQKISTLIYLSVADVLWPFMIPLSILLMEENIRKRNALKILLGLGTVLSLYYAYFIIFFKITPEILNCHIFYNTSTPKSLMIPSFLIYLEVTLTPLFISSVKRMKIFGLLAFLSVVVSVIFFTKNTTSVWCFFAAVLSIVIFVIVREPKKV
jgi:hypothetical protein